jgi:hypothetical protein
MMAGRKLPPLPIEGGSGHHHREDARHWVTVYDELIALCRHSLGGDHRDSRMAMRLREFEQRRAFWMSLLEE